MSGQLKGVIKHFDLPEAAAGHGLLNEQAEKKAGPFTEPAFYTKIVAIKLLPGFAVHII